MMFSYKKFVRADGEWSMDRKIISHLTTYHIRVGTCFTQQSKQIIITTKQEIGTKYKTTWHLAGTLHSTRWLNDQL